MAATQENMADLSSPKPSFLPPSDEEPELSSINFQQSLRFFQEQLMINGKSNPSTATTRLANNDANYKYGILFTNSEKKCHSINMTNEGEMFKESAHSLNSCRIQIPTVDTILESVRVLRAIQKSQEQRGSMWSLDVEPDANLDTEDVSLGDVENFQNVISRNNMSLEDGDVDSNEVSHNVYDDDKRSENQSNMRIQSEVSLSNAESSKNEFTASQSNRPTFWPSNTIMTERTVIPQCSENLILDDIVTTDIHSIIKSTGETIVNYEGVKDVSSTVSTSEVVNTTATSNTSEVTEVPMDINCDDDVTSDIPVASNDNGGINSLSDLTKALYSIDGEMFGQASNGNSSIKNLSEVTKILYSLDGDKFHQLDSPKASNECSYIETRCSSEQSSIGLKVNDAQNKDHEHLDKQDNQKFLPSVSDYSMQPTQYERENDTSKQTDEFNGITGCNPSKHTHWSDSGYEEQEFSDKDNSFRSDSSNFSFKLNISHQQEIILNKISSDFECETRFEIPQNSTEGSGKNEDSTDEIHCEKMMVANCITEENISKEREVIKTKAERSIDMETHLQISCPSPTNLESFSDTGSSYYVSAECSPCASFVSVFDLSARFSSPTHTESPCKTEVLENEWKADTLQMCKDLTKEDFVTCEVIYNTRSSSSDILEAQPISDEQIIAEGVSPSKLGPGTDDDGVLPDTVEPPEIVRPLNLDFDDSYRSFTSIDLTTSSPNASSTDQSSFANLLPNIDADNSTDEITDEVFAEKATVNGHNLEVEPSRTEIHVKQSVEPADLNKSVKTEVAAEESPERVGKKKVTASSWNLVSIAKELYVIQEVPPPAVFKSAENKFKTDVYLLSKGAFCEHPEGNYSLSLERSSLRISQDSHNLLCMSLNYGEVHAENKNVLLLDNKLGRCLHFKCNSTEEVEVLKGELELSCCEYWKRECINLVHYPLKCHKNVVIIDLGSCSTRAGILMDQPTLPTLFFPTVCATHRITGHHVYGMEALQTEVRQNSILSFPVRPSAKIIKHTIDINLLEGLFKKVFHDLHVDPTEYTVQVCLPRSLSISAQNALVKLLLEDLNVQSVSLTHQALLTLYAHDVSTAIVVDIGDRMDILPIVDGFIVENGVTRLPYGGQRLIHHMKHALAEKHISLSNDIESFVVQYIMENLSYVAEDYESEILKATQRPDIMKKSVALRSFAIDDYILQYATLDEARFKIPEGLFKPELWGLDNPGIHQLVQKAIQATGVDVRKRIAENIYVSGGVTLTPGFVERLSKEVSKLNKAKVVSKVIASNYRYHCTYIGACKFAKMDVFPQVCLNLEEYKKDQLSSLKKFVLCF